MREDLNDSCFNWPGMNRESDGRLVVGVESRRRCDWLLLFTGWFRRSEVKTYLVGDDRKAAGPSAAASLTDATIRCCHLIKQ